MDMTISEATEAFTAAQDALAQYEDAHPVTERDDADQAEWHRLASERDAARHAMEDAKRGTE